MTSLKLNKLFSFLVLFFCLLPTLVLAEAGWETIWEERHEKKIDLLELRKRSFKVKKLRGEKIVAAKLRHTTSEPGTKATQTRVVRFTVPLDGLFSWSWKQRKTKKAR